MSAKQQNILSTSEGTSWTGLCNTLAAGSALSEVFGKGQAVARGFPKRLLPGLNSMLVETEGEHYSGFFFFQMNANELLKCQNVERPFLDDRLERNLPHLPRCNFTKSMTPHRFALKKKSQVPLKSSGLSSQTLIW